MQEFGVTLERLWTPFPCFNLCWVCNSFILCILLDLLCLRRLHKRVKSTFHNGNWLLVMYNNQIKNVNLKCLHKPLAIRLLYIRWDCTNSPHCSDQAWELKNYFRVSISATARGIACSAFQLNMQHFSRFIDKNFSSKAKLNVGKHSTYHMLCQRIVHFKD